MNFWKLFLVTFLPVTAALAGDGDLQRERFKQWLKIIEAPLASSADPKEAAKALDRESKSRIAAFNLQALGRLYEPDSEDFKKIRKNFKKIEDALGDIDRASSTRNEEERDRLKKSLQNLIRDKGWAGDGESPLIEDTKKILRDFNWLSPKKDGELMAKRLEKQLQGVVDTEWNFTFLEAEAGLHEFRREMRWFLIEARVLNGFVTFKEGDACPDPVIARVLSEGVTHEGYGSLPENPAVENPCRISRCLFVSMVKSVGKFGDLKDRVERMGSTGDRVPDEVREEANREYAKIQAHNPMPYLIEELQACQE